MLVCEQDENRILAETILSFIVQYSHAHIMNMDQKMAEVITLLYPIILLLLTAV